MKFFNFKFKHLLVLGIALITCINTAWGTASTSSDGKYASGTITFADFGSMSATTNYWYNGIKIYSGASQTAQISNSRWATEVIVPTYISNVNAGKSTNAISWGSNGAGKQYSMSGLALNTHAIGIHVNGKCTVTVVVDKNIGSDTDDAGISASVDATAYGTAWTSSNYSTAGTALTVTSTRADKTNYPGRYTLTIPITTDGEKVVKISNSSSGTGAGKLFCFESITVTASGGGGATTYDVNIDDGITNGSVSASPTSAEEDETVTLTVTPSTGYELATLTVTGDDTGDEVVVDENEFSMPAEDVTVSATFSLKNYTVTLNNQSATSAGTESVTTTYNANTNLTSAITCPTKTSKVFAGYFTATNGGGVQLIDPAGNWIASAGGDNTYMDGSKNWKYDNNLTLYACWMEYCSGMDMEAYVNSTLSSGSTTQTFTILGTNKFIYSLTTGSSKTEFDNSSDATGQYDGLKIKSSGDYVMFLVQAGYSLSVKWGYVKSSKPEYSINGGAAQTFSKLSTGGDNSSSPGDIEISSQSYDQLVKIWSTDDGATVLKKITITASCTAPTTTFGNGEYTADATPLDLSTLIGNNNSEGTITYSVTNANGTGATVTGSIFRASTAGTAYVRATQAADDDYCEAVLDATVTVSAHPDRVFKTGDVIYFRGVNLRNTLGGGSSDKAWVSDGDGVYAYFYDNSVNTWQTSAGAYISGSGATSVYKFTVPQYSGEDHSFTHVIFTRGTNSGWSNTHNQTWGYTARGDKNLFIINDSWTWDSSNSRNNHEGYWSKYTPSDSPALIGEFNSWNPDKGVFKDYVSNKGKVFMNLPANTTYQFRVLIEENEFGLNSAEPIDNTLGDWWKLYSGQGVLTMTTGEAGVYAFHWEKGSGKDYLGIYYPQARLKKGKYIYADLSKETGWDEHNPYDVKFVYKYYDSGDWKENGFCDHDTIQADADVFYTIVPDSTIGALSLVCLDDGNWATQYCESNAAWASTRSSSAPNCLKEEKDKENYENSWTPQWTTYCPPMSSATLSDNGTTKTAIGSGTEGSPYIVVTGTTIKVSAEAESAIDDDNMTAKYNFKVGGSSQQNSTTTTYTHEASTNNTVYAMSVSAYNNYNSTDGTPANSNVIYYKALNSYTISYSAGGEDGVTGSHDSDTKYYGIDLTLPGVVFSKTGYTQTGWATSKGGDKAYNLSITNYSGNADATLYPVWTANPISVTLAKGTNGAANQSATINYDATTYASFTAVSGNTGYRCTGYYDGETLVLNADGSFAADNVTGYITSGKWTKASDCTLTAHWEGIPYSITYKDQGDETFSGTHETGYPTSHTYGSTTALKKATKTGYAFAGWYTTSTCTGDAITSIGATAYSSNITLYARWVELDLHEPGIYEKPEANDGYGRPLKLNSSHDYEVYLFTIEDSKGSIYAGPKTAINDGFSMISKVATETEAKPTDEWFSFKASTFEGSETTVGTDEYSQLTSSSTIGDSRYAMFKASSYLRLRVSGYDEFSFIGRDNTVDSKEFVVRIDGKTQSYTHNVTDKTAFRFELDPEKEHFIELTTSTDNSNRFRGFSLRLPDVTRYTVSATNTDGYGSVDVTSISNVRSGSTIYTSSNTLTVGGTTVTATENSSTAQYSYAFNNWTKGDGTSLPGTVTGAITVRANFTQTPVNYTLAWNANGGDALSGTYTSGSTGYGTAIMAPNDPTRDGYTFTGWNTASNGSGDDYTGSMPAANTTYYAQWEADVYEDQIVWVKNSSHGGEGKCMSADDADKTAKDNNDKNDIGHSYVQISSTNTGMRRPANVDDVFSVTFTAKSGYYIQSICTYGKIEESSGAYYSWDGGSNWTNIAQYSSQATKTFDAPDATEPTSFIIKYTCTNTGSGGIYWRNAVVTLDNVTPSYALTWDFNGGGCSETAGDDYTAGGSVESGTTLVYPSNASMSKPGYRFNGWSSTPSTMPASDLTLTAQWVAFDLRTVSGLDVDAGATLSSIPLSWSIPGICDLKGWTDPLVIPNNGRNEYGVLDKSNSSYNEVGDYDYVTANGNTPIWGQFGVGFNIPETSSLSWLSYEWKGTFYDATYGNDVILCGVSCDDTYAYWKLNGYKTLNDDSQWNESGQQVPDKIYWAEGAYPSPAPTVSQIVIYANAGNDAYDEVTFSVRNVRYGIDDDKEDIDHIVLMRKEGSAATGIADPSATKLYEGTKSHYTDASDVTGKNYYYTVFAVHANGAVSTGVSTSLTLYTITYNAGENGSGTVAADKKTHGINFTLSSSTFTRDGYTQDGWSTSDGGPKDYVLGGTYSTDEDVTLYPHWVADAAEDITNGNPSNGTISITDGVSSLSKASAGTTVTITATPATGYNFTSWDVYKTDDASTKVSTAAATASTTFTMPAYAVTVNASFSAKTYTVTLNGNGGSGNTANVTATYGSSSFSSSITNPTKTGYIFDG